MSRRRKQTPWREDRPLEYAPDVIRAVICRNEFHEGRALWERKAGVWHCAGADACLDWMKKLDPDGAKLEAVRRGFDWNWEPLL